MSSRIVHAAAVLAAVASARPVAAEPASNDPPGARVGFYTEMMMGYGRSHGESTEWDGDRRTFDTTVLGLRWALGARIANPAMDLRLGTVVDVTDGTGEGAAIGVELQLDWPLGARWRGGVRLSGSKGLEGELGTAGLRLRNDAFIIGLEALRAENREGHVSGWMTTVGFGGRPGNALMGTSAVAAAVLGVILAATVPRT